MALDLEEQEQVDELKALWKKYGSYVTKGAIAFFLIYGLFQGWGYYHLRFLQLVNTMRVSCHCY